MLPGIVWGFAIVVEVTRGAAGAQRAGVSRIYQGILKMVSAPTAVTRLLNKLEECLSYTNIRLCTCLQEQASSSFRKFAPFVFCDCPAEFLDLWVSLIPSSMRDWITLSSLFPTSILTTDGDTYVSSSVNLQARQ